MKFNPNIASGLLAVLIAIGAAGPVTSADFSDPTWPCIQRKVDTLSLGLMWPHEVSGETVSSALADEAATLVDTLALRRVSIEEAETHIGDFAIRHPDLTKNDLGNIFRGVFDRIQSSRSAIISGIERYSLKQIALAQAIDDTRKQMSVLMDSDAPDYDTVDLLEEQLDWDERIYRDRAQSLTYVCETPVILEKRAYAIAQALLQHVPEQE